MQQAAYSISQRRAITKKRRWEYLLFLYSFLMAFPSILILGQNASVLVFGLMMLFFLQNSRQPLLGMTMTVQWFAALFALGAVLSTINIPHDTASNAFDRALAVLPNYLYWSLLVIIFIQQRQLIKFEIVYKAIFWGIISTVLYYLFFQQTLQTLPIFNRQTPNTFAFILICYSPIAIHYLKERKSKTWALALLSLLVIILLRDGRRAGMVLVLFGGIGVLYADRINWKRLLAAAIAIPIMILLLYSSPVESYIFQSSDRIYEMIYQPEKIQKEDRSYLTRVAMVKKGLAIFDKHPFTGIGLNNFSNISVDFDKSFEGAKYVVNKYRIQEKSAHNSYISVLSEGGLFLLVPLIIILAYNIVYFIRHFFSIPVSHKPVFIGIIGMSVHLYFISDIVNVFAWFLIGLASALCYRR